MISTKFDDNKFFLEMSNIVKYAEGYVEGIQLGKPQLLEKMGTTIKGLLEEFVDTNARIDPRRLHHVYEWYQVGSPAARLFDIDYAVTNGGLTFGSTFSQSRSLANGATVPFYDKAKIMESGVPITLIPKQAKALRFEENGEEIFSKGPITINNPGGQDVQGSFNDIIDLFFERYLSQSYLIESGFSKHLENPVDFKTNIGKAKSGGKAAGRQIGYNWIVKAGSKL